MGGQPDVLKMGIGTEMAWPARGAKWLLPIGWGLAAIGFLGPWISHPTAALTLSGADMAEFVKFLPDVLDGSLRLVRQSFYLPPFAITLSIASLIGSRRLQYASVLRAAGLLLALLLSIQLLPPAWSPSTLTTPEFRAQTLGLGASWLLLTGFSLLGHLPSWLAGSFSAGVSLLAFSLALWQFLMAKPSIDTVYATPPGPGWGLFVCLAGLGVTAAAGGLLVLWARSRVGIGKGSG